MLFCLVVLFLALASATSDVALQRKDPASASSHGTPERTELARSDGESTGCQCQGDTCGCCVHLSWSRVGINGDVCANLTYNPSQLSIGVTLTYAGLTLINETVSARNPDVCAHIPYLKKLASICLDFSNVSYSSSHLSGCADIRAELIGITLYKEHLGCFDIHVLLSTLLRQMEPALRRKMRI
jgi:hypothetical protein